MNTDGLRNAIISSDIKNVTSQIKKLKKEEVNIFNVSYEKEIIPTLHLAAIYDREGSIIQKLIDEGADIERLKYQPCDIDNDDYQPTYGNGNCTALGISVMYSNYESLEKLLQLGANPNGKKDTLDNPLIYSICQDNIEDAEKFTLLLLSWEAEFIKQDLKYIIDEKYEKIKRYISKDKLPIIKEKYESEYFFTGDKEERKKFLDFIEEVFEEVDTIIKDDDEDMVMDDEEE